MTDFCTRAIAQSALQIISQGQRLDDIWGLFKHPTTLYGILTNGLEWKIVAYESGEWVHHSSVINTSKVSSTGKRIADADDGTSCLAKAIRKVPLNRMVSPIKYVKC